MHIKLQRLAENAMKETMSVSIEKESNERNYVSEYRKRIASVIERQNNRKKGKEETKKKANKRRML